MPTHPSSTLLNHFTQKWLNTPFHANAMAPGLGGGVDCIHLAQAWLLHIGLIHQPLKLPSYATDWGIHSPHTEQLFHSFLNSPALHGKLTTHPYTESNLHPGDLIAFRTGTSIGHLGILIPKPFTQPTQHRYPENAEGSSRWEGSQGSARECINIHDHRADPQDTSHTEQENAEESAGCEGFEVRAKECMPILDCSSHPTNPSHADFKKSRYENHTTSEKSINGINQYIVEPKPTESSALRVLHCLKPRGVLTHRPHLPLPTPHQSARRLPHLPPPP